MRKIFLDIGAWDGTSARFFRKYHPQGEEFEIYSFECDKDNIQKIEKQKLPITLIKAAAWTYDGKRKFFPGGCMPGSGGSLYPNKTTGNVNPKKYFYVDVIDLARFIRTSFRKEDYIILKMNCEGCEYTIIPHLHKNGLIPWISKWYVQWHYEKLSGMTKSDHNKVADLIPTPYRWLCQCNQKAFVPEFLKSLKD